MSDVPEWPEVRERFLPTAVAEWSLIQDTMIGGRHAYSSIGVGHVVDREEMARVRDAGRKSLRNLAEHEEDGAVSENEDDEARDWRDDFWDHVERNYELLRGDK